MDSRLSKMEDILDTDSSIDLTEKTSDFGAHAVDLGSGSTQTLNEETAIEILNAGDIVGFMNEMIAEVSSIIEEDVTITRILLTYFNWDKQNLLERFYGNDKRTLFEEANILKLTNRKNSTDSVMHENEFSDALLSLESPVQAVNNSIGLQVPENHHSLEELQTPEPPITISGEFHPPEQLAIESGLQQTAEQPIFGSNELQAPEQPITTSSEKETTDMKTTTMANHECNICYASDSKGDEQLHSLTCGHKFCYECWKDYLTHNILKEGMAQNLSCAAYGCNILVSDKFVMQIITDELTRDKYQQLISNSFVSCNKNLRWCPAANCGKAIKAEPYSKHVTCCCGEKFCFQCGDMWHEPIRCAWIKQWRNKVSADSSTVSWIASNTKECPKCSATIEKDGGCNHMICRKDNCMYEFCWVCMGPWQEHGQNAWYNCNRFNEKTSKQARSAMETSREGMLRFLHYYNRYSNHQQSMKLESEIYTKVNQKIEEIRQQEGHALTEVNFLKQAVDTLCNARRILMVTYIFAYFAVQNNQTLIFEENQRDLELATEHLSEYLEREIYKTEPQMLKQKVTDKAIYCGRRFKALISHIHEGYESNWWQIDESRKKSV